jgi:argininosuccinate lyase
MLWGGRFKEKLNEDALKFSSSIGYDKNLIFEDILASKIHAEMLAKIGIINYEELLQIKIGLDSISDMYSSGTWVPDENFFEDIHSAIESKLNELIGPAAKKLHTGRSRNDQVATAIRMWIKNACINIKLSITGLQKQLAEIASAHTETIIPGYTHLQRAQPISFAFHLLAYVEMLQRDKKRFAFVFDESNESPLGSGALAGSTLVLDRLYTSEKLGFKYPTRNALDSVSDRDFLLDFLNSCAVGMMHLSRFAEEIVIWTSAEWKFVKLSDKYTTGSSLMPQKKNSDMAELTRGKSGRVYGNLFALLTTMKGLPLSYNRDMQEDKEPVFDSFETYLSCLTMIKGMLETMQVNSERFSEELKNDFILSTDLADWLVTKGIPFREAHEIVGKVVLYSEENKKPFSRLELEDLQSVNKIFDNTALECLDIKNSLKMKKTYGSPNPKFVKEQIAFWIEELSK